MQSKKYIKRRRVLIKIKKEKKRGQTLLGLVDKIRAHVQ